MMAAASAWSALAAELNSAALGYDNVVTQLASEEWLGPASAAMAAAVQPYVAWMTHDRRAGRGGRHPGSVGRGGLRDGARLGGAAADDRAQPRRAGPGGADQRLGPEQRGHRAAGSPVRRILGPKRRGRCTATPGQSAAATKVTPFTTAPDDRQPGRCRHSGRGAGQLATRPARSQSYLSADPAHRAGCKRPPNPFVWQRSASVNPG